MASVVHADTTRSMLAGDGPDLNGATIKACLFKSSGHAYAQGDDFIDDLTVGARATGGIATLANPTVTRSANVTKFDADDAVFAGPTGAGTFDRLAIYADSGAEATSRWIATLELSVGLVLTGAAVEIRFHSTNGIALFTNTGA